MVENTNEQNIFFEQPLPSDTHHPHHTNQDVPISIPYLKRGDSNLYIDQFLVCEPPIVKIEEGQTSKTNPSNEKEQPNASIENQDIDESSEAGKFRPSAFHNFQKHLTICLKFSIEIAYEEKSARDYQRMGAKMWKIFKNSSVTTKKILHFLLGEKNEHKITEQGLREYGLATLYHNNHERILKQARNYLAQQTLRQIHEGKLENFIEKRTMKNKKEFRQYVKIFIEQLQEGFLRKRLPRQKVSQLLRHH